MANHLIIPVLEKARKDLSKLIARRVQVFKKDGAPYWTTVYVKPSDVAEDGTQRQFDFQEKPVKPGGVKPPEQKEKPAETTEEKKYYEDVGKKIGGAKKDIWAAKLAEMNLEEIEKDPKEAYQVITKANILGKFDPELYKDQGYSAQAVQLIKEFYASVAPRPPDNPQARQAYVQYLHDIHDALQNARTVGDIGNSLAELLESKKEIPAFQKRVPSTRKRRGLNLYYMHATAVNEIYSTLGARAASFLYVLASRNDMQIKTLPYPGGISSDRWEKLKETFNKYWMQEAEDPNDWSWTEEGERKGPVKKKQKFIKIVDEKVKRIGGRKIKVKDPATYLKTFGIRAVEYGNYVAKDKEAGDYHTRRCAEALADLADTLGIEDRQISFNGRLALAFGARGSGRASAHYEPVKTVINITKFRGGGSLAHEWFHFVDNILSEVENNKPRRGAVSYLSKEKYARFSKSAVRKSFEALIETMRYKQITKDLPAKRTEIQFAEPTRKANFLSIFNHAKAIHQRQVYREPAGKPNPIQHALGVFIYNADNFFGKGSSRNHKLIEKFARFAINQYLESGQELPQTIPVGFQTETDYYTASEKMGGYWRRNQEMAARAFESYVSDKLERNGKKSTYLVSGSKSELYQTKFGSIYPGGEERKNLYNAFEKLIDTVREEKALEKAIQYLQKDGRKLIIHK